MAVALDMAVVEIVEPGSFDRNESMSCRGWRLRLSPTTFGRRGVWRNGEDRKMEFPSDFETDRMTEKSTHWAT